LNIDAVSVSDLVFMLGAVARFVYCSTFSAVTRNCSAEIGNLGAFFGASPARERPNAICSPGWQTGWSQGGAGRRR